MLAVASVRLERHRCAWPSRERPEAVAFASEILQVYRERDSPSRESKIERS